MTGGSAGPGLRPARRVVGRSRRNAAITTRLVGYLFFSVAGGSVIPQPAHCVYLVSACTS